jgi:hypothetical protein
MRPAALERRDARDRESLRSEREAADEPGEVHEVASPGVLDVAREREGMELLGNVLVDRIDREARSPEAQPLEDRIGKVRLELANDDVGSADVDLEPDEPIPARRATTTNRRPPPGGPSSGAGDDATS